MLPYITILGRNIPTYGMMAAAGILAGLLYLKLAERRARRDGTLDVRQEAGVELAAIYGMLGCVAGSKLLFLLTQLPQLIAALRVSFFRFLSLAAGGGFVFYGGLYGFLLAVRLYARISRLDFDRLMAFLAPVIPLFHGFGRIGCFLGGCCYGRPTDSFLGIAYTHADSAPNGVPLLPVQLFEAAVEFLLFAVLARLSRRRGGVWLLKCYLLVYSAWRFFIEFFRGDAIRGFWGPLSTSQVIAAVTVLCVLLTLVLPEKRRRAEKAV